MRSGALRHRIAIQEGTPTGDGMGGETMSWSDVSGLGSVPAAIWPLRSKERINALKLELDITHKIRMRYCSGITSKNRVMFGTRVFEIDSIINLDNRSRVLEILAREVD